jgi:group I intron endonuclease
MKGDPANCSRETIVGNKLSNSGEALKLMIPSHNINIMSGWSNDPCTVTSRKIDEKKMGNRGSKSNPHKRMVKEQRVDGNWCIASKTKFYPMHLRCTLMDFERNYQIKTLSKQLNKNFSTFNNASIKPMTRLQPFFSTIEFLIGYLHLAEIQNIIIKELKGKSGIYGFLCQSNNKLYIGSSIDLSTRFNNHIKGFKSNILLQRAINKYNLQDFYFIIFEYCEPEELLSREQFYLDEIKPEFNILKTAGSLLGYKHTEESIAKMSEIKTGQNNPNFGITPTAETKALISETKKGENNPMFGKTGESHPRFGTTHSAESIAKISAAKKGKSPSAETIAKFSLANSKKVFIYSFDPVSNEKTLYKSFDSYTEVRKYFDCSERTLSNYVDKNKLYKKQWILTTKKI